MKFNSEAVNSLISEHMTYMVYQEQQPVWEGFEYVVKNLDGFAEVMGYAWWCEFACLQYSPSDDRYTVYDDTVGAEDVSKDEFLNILAIAIDVDKNYEETPGECFE